MRPPRRVVVVGEGVAGVTAARELRALGFDGGLTVVGDEVEGAYARPPLSKQVLTDAAAEQSLRYDVDDLDAHHRRCRASGLDPARQQVLTDTGESLPYDALVVASGSAARTLAAPGQRGELVLRTLADARRLRERLHGSRSVVVVGGGFLGMEVATAARALGADRVTVVDVDPPLSRLLGPVLSQALTAHVVAAGITVELTGPVTLVGDPVCGVELPDGRRLEADTVVSCVGDLPRTRWLRGTGLEDPLGVPVDEHCASALPGVWAVGDVARVRTLGDGRRRPFWSNAVAQARVAAAAALGRPSGAHPGDDYVWTTIAGLSIKAVGPLPLTGELSTVEGDLRRGSALLRSDAAHGTTVVAFGTRTPPAALRRLALQAPSPALHPGLPDPRRRTA